MSKERHAVAIRNKEGEAIAVSESLFPSRETIDSFETYHKGAAAEILDMSRVEQVHTHKMEAAMMKCETICRILGMALGVVSCLALIAAGVYLIVVGKGWGGYPTVIVAFFTLITSVIKSSGAGKQRSQ